MFIANLEFMTELPYDHIEEWIKNLVHNMHHQGRIVHLRNNIYRQNDCIILQCKIPESDSISAISENKWFKKLQTQKVDIRIKCLGKDLGSKDLCCCGLTKFYILLGSEDIPLVCGSCGDSVPLYRIPPTYEPDPSFYDVDCWNKENLAWSDIEFYSYYEQIAQKELSDLGSILNKKALDLRSKIEKLSGKDCYYFLEELRETVNIETGNKCPGCGGEWLLEEPVLEYYNFKCDHCKILSRFSVSPAKNNKFTYKNEQK